MGVAQFSLGIAAALAALFALASFHKVLLLARRHAADEPVIAAAPKLSAHPRLALAAGLAGELTLAGALVLAPRAGLVAAGLVLAFYARLLARLSPRSTCHCFGSVAATPVTLAIRRNVVLACLAICGAGVLVAVSEPPVFGSGAVAVGAVVLTVVLATAAFHSVFSYYATRSVAR